MFKLSALRDLPASGLRPGARVLIIYLLLTVLLYLPFNPEICAAQSRPAKISVAIPAADLQNRLAALEKAVEARRQALGIPGLSLAIVRGDKIIFSKGFGLRDIEKKLPVTPDTLFAIGSATKAFTAMALMMSADEGKLSLDDSPKKFLPYFRLRDPEADTGVTLRDLLCHRTGVDRADLSLAFSGSLTREELIRIAGVAKPTAKFREKWQYQNTMFVAAGEAAAKANQTSWEKLVAAKIFKPLKMRQTDTSISEMRKSKDFSLGYDYNPETKEAKVLRMIDLDKIAPAGAINSNAREMAGWVRLMLGEGSFENRRLISKKNFDELFTAQIQIAPKLGYGLGWFIRDWHGRKEIDHGGNIDGFNATVAMIPEEHLGFVMLSNVSVSPLGNEIREILYSNLLDIPKNESTAAAAPTVKINTAAVAKTPGSEISPALKAILGNYETETKGTPIDIVAERGGTGSLIIQGRPPLGLIEKDQNNFVVKDLPEGYFLAVKRDAGGKITNLIFNQGASAVALRRITLPPNAPPVGELMARVADAAGGAANLRKHTSVLIRAKADLEYEGMTSELIISGKAPNSSSTLTKYIALGKEVGKGFEYFDGSRGGYVLTGNKALIETPSERSGKLLEDARRAADFYAPLNWKTAYQKIELKKASNIAGEPVFVVVKTPENGYPVTDYISQKSFLVLRRESFQPSGESVLPYTEDFSDYRNVDGVAIPFKIVSGSLGAKPSTLIVESVTFDSVIPDSAFHPTTVTAITTTASVN